MINTVNQYLQIAVASPLRQALDYLPPLETAITSLLPGVRIKVPFRNKATVGILLDLSSQAQVNLDKLKQADAILDETPLLPSSILQLARWASDYYHHPIGEVVLNCLPTYLRQGKTPKLPAYTNSSWSINTATIPDLNAAQQTAIQQVQQQAGFQTFLLDGITGSGKTEVYLQLIGEVIARGQQALVLVPEIGLTPQTVARFKQRFAAPIVVLHSNLNEKQRAIAWLQAKCGHAAIVIGTRSAIFTPLAKPGIIILDEEHDLSFKQQNGFRYSARDIAILRGQLENIPVLLGSATPSLETLYNTERQRFVELSLPERAGNATQPVFNIVDIRNQTLDAGLSPILLNTMQQHLAQQGQVLLFLNRRGFAPVLMCHSCGWYAACKRCDAKLTLHLQPPRLFCHHCEAQHATPKICPECQSTQLLPLGLGTERLEAALARHFPQHTIVRIDRDNTQRKGALEKLLTDIQSGASQIMIGTQMLTKGHHFPNVTLVGIIDVDSGLFSADFRASERMGQLITQVAGRAGRATKAGTVLLQTHHPAHPLLQTLIYQGYKYFAQSLLAERKAAQLPPFGYMVLFRAEAVSADAAWRFLLELRGLLQSICKDKIDIQGPSPALMARKAGMYRSQLLISSGSRQVLQRVLKILLPRVETLKAKQKVRWSVDVDPQEMN